jgi:hypothetical protein
MNTMDVLAPVMPAPANDDVAVRAVETPRPVAANLPGPPRPAPAPASGALGTIDTLLRDRAATLARIARGEALADLVRTMLLTIAVSCAIFGAAVGMYRGGVQILYAAIKFPLVMLLTAAITAPCLTAFNAAVDRPYGLRRDVALVLLSLGFGSLLLVAQAPILLLGALLEVAYHKFILMTFGCAALAGLGSLGVLGRGIRGQSGRHARITSLALVGVLAVVGAQVAWTMRPYVVRPRTTEVPFVRQIEGSLLEAVMGSSRSARGIYAGDLEDWDEVRAIESDTRAIEAQPDVRALDSQPGAYVPEAQPEKYAPEAQPGAEMPGAQPGAEMPGAQPGAEMPGAQPGAETPGAQPEAMMPGAQPEAETPGAQPAGREVVQ